MDGDYCKVVTLDSVEVQENGIIRDNRGKIMGRADDIWMGYQWRLLESGVCPCCERNAYINKLCEEREANES